MAIPFPKNVFVLFVFRDTNIKLHHGENVELQFILNSTK